MLETLDSWIHAVGPLALLALGLAAMIEYLFPPFPGDTILLLGGVYAVRGDHHWTLVFLVVTAGSLVGAATNYWVGSKLAIQLEKRERFLRITRDEFHHLQARMRKSGRWLLLGNRFMPGVRSLIFLAAGGANLPFWRVMALGAASAMAWNLLVVGAGIAVGGNAERLNALFAQYQVAALGLLGAAALGWTVAAIVRRKKPSA